MPRAPRARGEARKKGAKPLIPHNAEIAPLDPGARRMVRATRAEVNRRTDQVMMLRLAGATWDDIKTYAQVNDPATGRPWHVKESALRMYMRYADENMKQFNVDNREKLLNRHRGMRQIIYRNAMATNQLEVALAATKDAARLEGLYPDDGQGKGGRGAGAGPITVNVNLLQIPPSERPAALAGGAIVNLTQLSALPEHELQRLQADLSTYRPQEYT